MIDIIDEFETKTDRTRVDHTNTICVLCGSTETSLWLKHYDDKGNWDKKSYKCNVCYHRIKSFGTPYIDDIKREIYRKRYKERICCKCGGTKTGKNFNGNPLWYKYKDKNDIWDRRSYVCGTCYDLKRIYGTYNVYEIEDKKNEYSRNKINGRKCCKCCSTESKGSWYKNYGSDGHWDGVSYLCHRCGVYKDYSTTLKPIANHRTKNLSRYTQVGKGYIGVQIIARTLGLEDCNIVMNNFCYYVDLSKHTKYGYIEVKISTYNARDGRWVFNGIKLDKCDTVILVCMDEKWKNIERIYIIPSKEINVSSIGITKNPSRSAWYDNLEKGYLQDTKPFNDTFHQMDIEKCPVLSNETNE